MRRQVATMSAVILSTLLPGCPLTLAQQSGGSGSVAVELGKKAPEVRTIIGCLSKTANTYVITGGAPGPKQFRITGGDTRVLKGQIGHTIRVVGTVSTNDSEENMMTPYNEGTTTGVGYNTIVAQKIRKVYGNCSEAGKEYPGDHE